ncbi:exo-alpha-sialidase [Cecembia sp.]|uniref:exo-alpha-sialidase n=1 Tax=Cecembia sp. TaxID=1898110 RepID=UPI0025BE1AB2|nr:exo-alpha-sialidase [Cecembia sp.]
MKANISRIKVFGISILFIGILLYACGGEKSSKSEYEESVLNLGPMVRIEAADAHLPYLFTQENKVFLSWVGKSQEKSQLFFNQILDSHLGPIELVAEGDDWFVNWADYPQISTFKDGSLLAVFLRKSGPGTFSYDVLYTISKNSKDWSEPTVLHDDKTQTEHGFVSMIAWGDNMLLTWLDGRNTLASQNSTGHHHHGQMTLRAAMIDSNGRKLEDWELDDRVCDCCQTGTIMSGNGPLVVFRDRSENEIRDIGLVRWMDGEWTQTQPVSMDLWEIAACPVNGPRISSYQNVVGITWFTAAKGQPAVKISFSKDNGKTFENPIRTDDGKPIGRVGIEMLNEESAFVIWMENQRIMGRVVNISGKLGPPLKLTKTSEDRSSGFPQMKRLSDKLWFAWTVEEKEFKEIQTGSILIDALKFP